MQGVRALHKYGEKPMRACVLYKMHVGGVGVVLFVRVLTGLLRVGMSLSVCLADSSHEVCVCVCCACLLLLPVALVVPMTTAATALLIVAAAAAPSCNSFLHFRLARLQVLSIQMHHTPLSVAQCGDVVGVHVKGSLDKCARGDILSDTRNGRAVATTGFTAHVCIVHHPTQIRVGCHPPPRRANKANPARTSSASSPRQLHAPSRSAHHARAVPRGRDHVSAGQDGGARGGAGQTCD
jgi:translation elongation factor EF-1alpha